MNNLNLNKVKWKIFFIKDIFQTVKKAKKLQTPTGSYVEKKYLKKSNLPRITVRETNNGIDSFVESDHKNFRVFENFISASFLGGVFYHPYKASIDMKVHALKLKDIELNENIAKFLIPLIRNSLKHSSYGNQISSTDLPHIKLMLPIDDNGKANWSFMESFIKDKELPKVKSILNYYNKKLINLNIDITIPNEVKWKDFLVVELFSFIVRGRRLKEIDREQGKIPFVTAGESNNGVSSFINNEKHALYQNAITIDMFGNAFYQQTSFKCDDNITVLKNERFSKYIYLFLVVQLKILKQKYSYATQLRPSRLIRDKIMLPVDDQGNPYWSYMENFIKAKERVQIERIIKHFEKRLAALQS